MFLQIVKEVTKHLREDTKCCAYRINRTCMTPKRSLALDPKRVEGIWRQIVDAFRGAILADWLVIVDYMMLNADVFQAV